MNKMYNLWKTLVGTIQGMNNEGSSKRATALGFYILSAIMVITYSSCYLYVVITNNKTVMGLTVINQYNVVLAIVVGTLTAALGLTSYEKKVEAKKEVDLNCDKINEVK